MIHGFGFHSFVWEALRKRLPSDYTVHAPDLPGYAGAGCAEGDLRKCTRSWDPDSHWVCWSLGGLLALDAIREGARPRSLTLIGTSPRMVRGPGWPHAVAPETFRAFLNRAQADPADTLYRFSALVSLRDLHARDVRTFLLGQMQPPQRATLLQGLDLLEHLDLRDTWEVHPVPQLNLWGGRDVLVPPTAVWELQRICPDHEYLLLEQAAHAPMISLPGPCAERILSFWRLL